MLKNIKKMKKNNLFLQITKKNKKYKKFLKSRISSHINKKLAKQMIEFALSKEQSLVVLNKIEQQCFLNKTPVDQPTINIVISQAGGGKSSISKLLLQKNNNTIFIDSDIYKQYNPLKDMLIQNCPTYFGHLTGLDSYLHRDYIYQKAIDFKYNILIEVTPSKKDFLFNIDLPILKKMGYKINIHIMAVSKINSLLAIHERYENQIISKSKLTKLTDINRAIDSFDAVILTIEKLKSFDYIEINIYKRKYKSAILVPSNKENCDKILQQIQLEDKKNTLKNINKRIQKIQYQMKTRNAPLSQIEQFKKITNIINLSKN